MRRSALVVLPVLALLAQTGVSANIRFAPPTMLDRDAAATSIAIMDADHDGALDVIAALPDSVAVYYGDMRGGVRKIDRIPIAGAQSLALADTDRDGFLDLVAMTSSGKWVAAGAMRGFRPPVAQHDRTAEAIGSQSVTVDLNRDGYPDVVTIDGSSNALSVRLGQKDGTFGEEHVLTLAEVPRAIAVADFDGDGKPDLVMIDGVSAEIALMRGDGSGGFADAIRITTDAVPLAIATGDIDRNGRPDVVVAFQKGIDVLPNITIPDRQPAPPDRAIHADSLRPKANDACTTLFTFNTFDRTVPGYRWNDPSNWNPHLPGANDVACIINPSTPLQGPVVVNGQEAIAGELDSNVELHIGAYDSGQLTLEEPPPTVSNISSLTLFNNGGLTSLHQLQLFSVTTFGGKISAVSPSPFNDAISVQNSGEWDNTSVNVSVGPIQFYGGVTIGGQMNLCNASTLFARGAVALNGIINNCGDGGTPVFKLLGSLNADASGNSGVFTDFQTLQGSAISTTTSGVPGTFTINGGPHTLLSTVGVVIADSTSVLINDARADTLFTDGGTLITTGTVSGILSRINSNLTVAGKLGHDPRDRGDFTNAVGGLVTIDGTVDGHTLTISNTTTGGTLDFACIQNGGLIDLQSSMSTSNLGAVISCGGTPGAPGAFRVSPNGGNLLVQGPLSVDSQTEFENNGTITVSSGPLTISGSPLGYRSAGQFNISEGTSVQIGGPYALESIASFTGAGTLENNGGPLSPGGATIQNLTNFGTINEPFNITGTMNWSGGTISGNGGYQNGPIIQRGATLNVGSTFGAGTLKGAWLEIDGTANFTSLSLSNHATVNLGPGGVATGQSIHDTDSTGTLSQNFNTSLTFTGPASVSLASVSLNGDLYFSTLQFFSPVSFGSFARLNPFTFSGSVVFESDASFAQGFQSFAGLVELTNRSYTGSPAFHSNVQIDPGAHLDGGHTQIFGFANIGSLVLGSSAETLTLLNGGTIPPGGRINVNGGTVEIQGDFNVQGVGIFGNGFVHVLHFGNLFGGSASGTTIATPLQNDGSLGANGGNLFVQSANNNSSGTLSGGNWYANGGSTLGLPGVTSNATSISANGTGARVSLGIPGLQTNAANGTLSMANGGTISAGSFTNLGTISIGAGSTFNPSSFTQTNGQTSLTDPTSVLSSQGGVPTIQGGMLQGIGIVQPGLQNSGGTIHLGFAPTQQYNPGTAGTLTVNGNYSETPAASLHAYIQGQDPTLYSSLHVTGSATFAGTIQLDRLMMDQNFFILNFVPNPGDAYTVVTYASHAGTFPTILGQDLSGDMGPGYIFNPYYNANNLTFIAEIPDPKVMIQHLESTIISFGLDAGTTQSLNSKLDAAHSALVRGDKNAACGQLGAVVNFTNAQTGKKITADQAAAILKAIQQIQAKIGCH